METSTDRCARAILDTVPSIVQAIRVEMRMERLHDLSVPQFRTLAFIGRQPSCSLSDVAEFIGLTAPTMSVLINGLVERGLVRRETSLLDRRRVMLNLTAAGEQTHTRALDGTLAWLSRLLAPLTEDDREQVINALAVLRPIFATDAPQPVLESEHA